jgi:aldose 1-epimerase
MFAIHHFSHAGFDIVALTDGNSGTQVEIIPAHSAMLHAFRIPHEGTLLNVIDNYSSLEDYRDNLSTYFKSAKLSPFACRIPSGVYQWEDKEYTINKAVTPDSYIHGLLYDVPFNIQEEQVEETAAVLRLSHRYEGEDRGYPFPYECEVEYRLEAEQRLHISTRIRNLSDKDMPLMDGWHPYFTTGSPVDELELQFTSEQIVEFNSQLVPTGKVLPYDRFRAFRSLSGVELDNSFLLNFSEHHALCTLRDPAKRIIIAFHPETAYPVLQLYIPPHRRSIAIENLTGAPNAFNNGLGLVHLPAGESRRFNTVITALAY